MNDAGQGGQRTLDVISVTKSFGGVRALTDVSFHMDAGEVLGIIGPNGAGKTTLINVVTGLMRPSSGQIVFEGVDVSKLDLAARARRGLVRSFQHTRTFAGFTTEQALHFAAASPRAREEASNRGADVVEQTMATFGLEPYVDQVAANLPYGVQKVLNLGLVAITRPTALLLDEPLAGVDPRDIERLESAIATIRTSGVGVAIVEHNVGALLRMADRVIVVETGAVIFEGSPDETRSSEIVRNVYLGHSARGVA